MKYLLFSGSLRSASLNRKLIRVAQKIFQSKPDNEVTVADLRELALPVYDGDIQEAGFPAGVVKLGSLIQASEALVISTPEYNGSIASPLKNAIDWVSRLRPVPFEGKPVLLLGASPGALGAVRGLGASRAPFEAVGCYLYPRVFGLAKADTAFTSTGDLADPETFKRVQDLLMAFETFAARFNSNPRSDR
jgi:chromate reductase